MRRDSFGLAKQAVFGTPVAAMEQFPPVESVDIKDAGEKVEAEETTGTPFPSRLEQGTKGFQVTAKGSLRPQSAPRILSGFLGAPTKTQPDPVNAPAAYSYLFDPAGADADPVLHSLLATMKDPKPDPIVALFSDALGDTLTLEAQPNGYLAFTAAYFAADYAGEAEPVPVIDVSKRFKFDTLKVYADIDGAGEEEIPSAAWNIAYGVAPDTDGKILGSRKLYDLQAGNRSCAVSFTPKTKLDEHFARALQDEASAVKLRMTALGAVIGGDVQYEAEAIVYLCEYTEAPAGITAGDRLNAIPVKATAALDTASGKFVTVEIVNTTDDAA